MDNQQTGERRNKMNLVRYYKLIAEKVIDSNGSGHGLLNASCDHHEHHGGDCGHDHCAEHYCQGN